MSKDSSCRRQGYIPKEQLRRVTDLEGSVLSRIVKVDPTKMCPSTGSTKALSDYRRNLKITKGIGTDGFDATLMDFAEKYAYNPRMVQSEREYLRNLIGSEFNVSFRRNLMVYYKFSDTLKQFSDKDHPSFVWNKNYQRAKQYLIDSHSKHNLKPVDYESDQDIVDTLSTVNTHPGWTFIRNGEPNKKMSKKKVYYMEGSYERWRNWICVVEERGIMNEPILISYRTQASGEYIDGHRTGKWKAKVRMVNMVDLNQVITGQRFIKAYLPLFKETGMYGGINESELLKLICDLRTKFGYWTSIDYSSFDQTISSWLLWDALDIIKQCFRLSESDEKQFDAWRKAIIHKDFVTDSGILHSDKGMPSGDPATQPGDCQVNSLATVTYLFSKGFNEEEFHIITMGDDNLIFTKRPLDLEDLSSYMQRNLGLIVKTDDKSSSGTFREHPKFLSRRWTWEGPWRCPKEILSRMGYPERRRRYNEDLRPLDASGKPIGKDPVYLDPSLVFYSFYCAYPVGMKEIFDMSKFFIDYPTLSEATLANYGTDYMPGVLRYQLNYLKAS